MPPRRKSIGKRSKVSKNASKKEKEEPFDVPHTEEVLNESPQLQLQFRENTEFSTPNEIAVIKEVELKELSSKFEELNFLILSDKQAKWDIKNWENYLYKSRDINPLILSEVNAFLTELDEDEIYDIKHVFQLCRQSQQICEDIKSALLECPSASLKVVRSWMESIKNLHAMMRKKIEIATFLLLRTPHEHISDESFNMEYCVQDTIYEEEEPPITLCLWGNLSKNVRHRGMSVPKFGFSFELSSELLKINCAVRILHTIFDNITPAFCESAIKQPLNLGEYPVKIHYGMELVEEIYLDEDSDRENAVMPLEPKALTELLKQIYSSELSAKKADSDKNLPTMNFTPPEEPELIVVNKAEHFVVGGLFHFDLFQLPYPTVKAGCWVITNWEEKILKSIPFKTSIIPIRHPKPDMSPAIAAEFADSEIKRFDKEMCSAISVSLQLPKEILFLEQPTPAFWVPGSKGFSTVGFFETKYEEVLGFKNGRD